MTRWVIGAERVARHHEIYEKRQWDKARKAVIARDMGLCLMCKAKGLTRPGTEIDHIVELTDSNKHDWNIAYNPDNLRCLCRECHGKRHGGEGSGLAEFLKPVGS